MILHLIMRKRRYRGISGGICGGIAGGKQYINQRNLDITFTDENLARTARGDQAANRSWGKDNNGNLKPNQGDNYSSYADYRQETTHPNQTVGKEITIKSDELSRKTRLDQTISDGNRNIIKGFELKSSDTATYQQGQKTYFADNGGKLVSDSMVTGAKSISQVGNQTLHVGMEIPTIRTPISQSKLVCD